MNLMQKLNEVMKLVGYVQKDKEIGKGSYAYMVATYDQVLAAVREHFVAQGIIVVTRQAGVGRLVPTGTFYGAKDGNTGTEAMRYEAMYEIDFINMDDPNDKITVPMEAHAIDQNDKAPGKAQTYATKAAIKKILLLESGDNEESRADVTGNSTGNGAANATQQRPAANPKAQPANTKAGPPASTGQIAFIGKKLTATNKTEADLLAHLGREKLDGMSEGEAKAALAWIAGKAA